MADHASVIFRERKKITDQLSEKCLCIYREISGLEEERLEVQYHGFIKKEEEQSGVFQEILARNREEDLRQGLTTSGPHRDDLYLTLNRKSMKIFASQGQMRTAALSLKLGQLRILKEVSGDSPVLLLDDVMSELDLHRRMNLLKEIGETQTFITFSDEGDLEKNQAYRTYSVYSQNGRAVIEERKAGPVKEPFVMKEPDFT